MPWSSIVFVRLQRHTDYEINGIISICALVERSYRLTIVLAPPRSRQYLRRWREDKRGQPWVTGGGWNRRVNCVDCCICTNIAMMLPFKFDQGRTLPLGCGSESLALSVTCDYMSSKTRGVAWIWCSGVYLIAEKPCSVVMTLHSTARMTQTCTLRTTFDQTVSATLKLNSVAKRQLMYFQYRW